MRENVPHSNTGSALFPAFAQGNPLCHFSPLNYAGVRKEPGGRFGGSKKKVRRKSLEEVIPCTVVSSTAKLSTFKGLFRRYKREP